MANHLQGGKFTASHTTIIAAVERPARAAAALACVSKISLGIIKRLPNGLPAIKGTDQGNGCLLVAIRGTNSLQELRVYTDDPERALAVMRAAMAGLRREA